MSFLARFRILTKILAIVVVMAAVAAGISFLGIHALASLNDGADNMKFAAQRALDAARANQNVIALNRAEFRVALDPTAENRADCAASQCTNPTRPPIRVGCGGKCYVGSVHAFRNAAMTYKELI